MPFVNLPDEKESRWGDSLTAEKDETVRLVSSEDRGSDRVPLSGPEGIVLGTQNLSACGMTKTHEQL